MRERGRSIVKGGMRLLAKYLSSSTSVEGLYPILKYNQEYLQEMQQKRDL